MQKFSFENLTTSEILMFHLNKKKKSRKVMSLGQLENVQNIGFTSRYVWWHDNAVKCVGIVDLNIFFHYRWFKQYIQSQVLGGRLWGRPRKYCLRLWCNCNQLFASSIFSFSALQSPLFCSANGQNGRHVDHVCSHQSLLVPSPSTSKTWLLLGNTERAPN